MRLIASLLALLVVQWSQEIRVASETIAQRSASTFKHAGPLPHIAVSYWYDWGLYGPFPCQSYESFGAESLWPNLLQTDDRCRNKEDGYIPLGLRGRYVPRPGPVMIENDGSLIWLDTRWDQAMDVTVQRYEDEDYITFWTGDGSSDGDFGLGTFIMLDKHYEVFKEITPAGRQLGDFHEFRITEHGSALVTIYDPVPANLSRHGGPSNGWLLDSMFQEIGIATDELLFEWRASEHFPIHESHQPMLGRGGRDFIISGRYFNIICVDGKTGAVKWQLGGESNDFEDLSDGAATNFTWNHHVTWIESENGTQLTLFDNEATNIVQTAEYSRGLLLDIDAEARTVKLSKEYISPLKLSTPSQGSMQTLPSGNILVGWGHTAAWTEFSADGEVLCETHISPVWFANFGWVKSYRTFKSHWVGMPKTRPDTAMRASEEALYVSWNGATEVVKWKLQSGPSAEGDDFVDHQSVKKQGFETRIEVPADANLFLRVAALDKDGGLFEVS